MAKTQSTHPLNTGFNWRNAEAPFKIISPDQANSWNENGYFLLEGVFSKGELAAVTQAIDPMEAKTNEFLRTVENKRQYIARADEITFALHPVLRSKVASDFAKHSVFANLCVDLLGPNCRLYWDQAVYKKPNCPEEFPWHQDNGYNFVSPQDYLTCWVPLVDTDIQNGCPWVLPGIHKTGTLNHKNTDLGWKCADGLEGAIPVEAKAGDVVVFSSLTPHRTGPNLTNIERKSYILQYCHDGSIMLPRIENSDDNANTQIKDQQTVTRMGTEQNHPDRQFLIVKQGQRV